MLTMLTILMEQAIQTALTILIKIGCYSSFKWD